MTPTNTKQKNIFYLSPFELKNHPANSEIYGDEDLPESFLKSIEKNGVLVPLQITSNKIIISGWRRNKAAKILKLETVPIQYVSYNSEEEELEALLDYNLQREKTFSQKMREAEKREVLEREKARKRQATNTGGKKLQLVDGRPQAEKGKSRDKVANSIGLNSGRQYDRAKKVWLRAKEGNNTAQKLVIAIDKGKETITGALRKLQKEQKKKRSKQERKELLAEDFNPQGDIICDSIENLLNYVKPETAHLILTDPPYPQEYLPLWEVLFEKAEKVLVEGGFLVTYTPLCHLQKILQMKNNLTFVWVIALIHSGSCKIYYPSRVKVNWKPLLIFVKGTMPTIPYYEDVLMGTGREKDLHHWQQALREAEQLINLFTKPQDLVIDPFLGSGTTVLAAKKTKRNFFGLDNDQIAVQTTLKRLNEECHQ